MTNIVFREKTTFETWAKLANNCKRLKSLSKLFNNEVDLKKLVLARLGMRI